MTSNPTPMRHPSAIVALLLSISSFLHWAQAALCPDSPPGALWWVALSFNIAAVVVATKECRRQWKSDYRPRETRTVYVTLVGIAVVDLMVSLPTMPAREGVEVPLMALLALGPLAAATFTLLPPPKGHLAP